MNSNIFGWDYPAGAEHDPNAPWNRKDPEVCSECEDGRIPCECEGAGCDKCDGEGSFKCPECKGEGVLYPE